jgi:hypothetical protein
MTDPTIQTNVIPSDSPSIYAALSSTQTLALVMPNGTAPNGVAGWLFHIPQETVLLLESEITDHMVEDNTSRQDQIALKPEKVTLRGLVAELTAETLGAPPAPSSPPPDLPLNQPLVPQLTPGAEQTDASISDQQASTDAIVTQNPSLLDYYNGQIGSNPALTAQAAAAGYFYQLWLGRMLFTVQTPWGVLTSMAIERVQITQPEDTAFQSQLEIVFKKFRVVQDVITPPIGTLSGRVWNQTYEENPDQIGTLGQTPVSSESQTQLLSNVFTG